MADSEKYRNKLNEMKSSLLQKTDAIKHDLKHDGISSNWTEQATETENDEVLNSLGMAAKHELEMIDAALNRIETGDYFTCSECGEAISEARLDLLPYTASCINCANEQEQ